jgi:hypothetical protein
LSDGPNAESSTQALLGIDRFHRSEEEYARLTGQVSLVLRRE